MKKYYIHYWANFANTYSLIYTIGAQPAPNEAKQITRAEALRLCREEIKNEKADCSDTYRPTSIYPANCDDPANSGYQLKNHIWIK